MNAPHIPPKSILVPFDFSPAGRAAWDLAVSLAGALRSSLEALYIYEAPMYSEPMLPAPLPTLGRAVLTDAVRERLLSELRRELGEGVRAVIREGFASDGILESAAERRFDLILMGTHGRTGVSRALLGSVAEAVSRRSPVPVMTVHGPARPPRKMLVPLNFTSYSLNALFAAAALAEPLGALVDVLFVSGEAPSESPLESVFDEAVGLLPAYFADKKPRLLRASGDAAQKIVETGAEYDLITLVAHRKSRLHDAMMGTTAERVLRRSGVPVLAVPDTTTAAAMPEPQLEGVL